MAKKKRQPRVPYTAREKRLRARLDRFYDAYVETLDNHRLAQYRLRVMKEMTNNVLHNLDTQSANSITSTNEEWRGCWMRMLGEINAALAKGY